MKIIHLIFFVVILGSLASCGVHSTEINGGNGGTLPTCAFRIDTFSSIVEDSGVNPFVQDGQLDSSRSYTYNIQPSDGLDVLMNSLCADGFDVERAFYIPSAKYRCMDARGPRPVIELKSPDTRILTFQEGFMQGSLGRLVCGSMEFRYSPK